MDSKLFLYKADNIPMNMNSKWNNKAISFNVLCGISIEFKILIGPHCERWEYSLAARPKIFMLIPIISVNEKA